MRDINTVIDQILLYVNNDELKRQLEYIKSFSRFTAPELNPFLYKQIPEVLEKFLPSKPSEFSDNDLQIVRIFINNLNITREELESIC